MRGWTRGERASGEGEKKGKGTKDRKRSGRRKGESTNEERKRATQDIN